LFSGVYINALVSFLPLIFTVIVFLVVVYAQNISVEIPLTFGGLRGFGRSWSLKLFYTSNIPVILMAALLANFQLMGRIGLQPTPEGLSCSFLGCFNQQGNPVSGVVYYLSSPRNLIGDAITGVMTSSEILRALIYLAVLSIGAMVFSVFWVSTSGMDAKSVSEQLESTGMQIPGYRRDPRIIESVLNRYIPALTLLGGLAIGLLAAFADFTGALGTGTGILLTVMILYNYYEELSAQPLEEAHPLVRKVLGE
jgi:preprotein translocase subunit SecY